MRSVWLLAASVLCTVSHHVVAANESGDSQDDENNDNNNDDGNFLTQATSRIEQDLVDMWDSSPSSWGDEYWEIFVTAIAIVFAVLLCHFIICCTPCFNDGSGDARGATPHGVRTATTAELTDKEKKRLLEEPILDPTKAPRTSTTATSTTTTTPVGSPTSAATDDTSYNPDGLMAVKSNETTTLPSNTGKRRRRNNTLWSEVVSVWSEFMQYGFSMRPVDDVDPEMYQKYEEEPPPRKTKSRSPRRRSKRGGSGERSFAIPEVPLASPTASAATDDVKPDKKVDKYPQGMIV